MTYHKAVLLAECIEGLNIKPNGIYVDVTFGGGGHSRGILKHLVDGKLFAFDRDDDVLENMPHDKNLKLIKSFDGIVWKPGDAKRDIENIIKVYR